MDTTENTKSGLSLAQVSRPKSIQTVTVTKQEPRIIVKNEPIIIEARRSMQQQVRIRFSGFIDHKFSLNEADQIPSNNTQYFRILYLDRLACR